MKAVCAKWVASVKNLPEWFEDAASHNEAIDVSADMILELYNTGNNVMLKHLKSGDAIIFVDNLGFTQR